MALVRRPRLLISGPVLLGFSTLFDSAWGSPLTPKPYPKVTPSRVGDVLLPFACPWCKEVRSAVIDRKTRLGYHDKERDFSWCPSCRGRYVINPKGQPLSSSLPAGATHAPALVE
jgi:hypothetical protein